MPVNLWQTFLLDQAAHPDCPDDLRDRWILCNAYLVTPRIDLRRLRRAVLKLRERHDSLRLRFEGTVGTWRARFDAPADNPVLEMDLGDLDDATFHAEISRLANAAMPLVGEPLAQFYVVRCGARGDVLVIRVHHAITDGHGMVVLTEDLTKLLIGMPVPGEAISHLDYITRFQSPPPHRAAEVAAFWADLHHDFPKAPDVGRKAKGMPPLCDCLGEVDQRQLIVEATPGSLRRFEAQAAEDGNSPTTCLFAANLEAICQCYDLPRLMFITHISRTDPALDTYMGDHTLDPVLPFQAGGTQAFDATVKRLAATLFDAIAHLPSDAARRGTPHEAALIAAGGYPSQFSVYQPRAMGRQDRSVFREGYYTDFGEPQQIGPITLTSLDISVRRRRVSEMQFDLGGARVRTGFEIHFDGIAYAETEIRKIADRICEILKLDQTRAVAS